MRFTKSHALLIIASVGFSFILIFSTALKNSGVSSLQQVFSRMAFSLPLIFLLIIGKAKLKLKDAAHFMLRGLVFSAFLLSALSSIAFGCPVPVTVALIYTQPFFTAIISFLSKREKASTKKIAIILIGIFGAFLASGLNLQQIAELDINLGIFLALFGGLLYALYLFLKRTEKHAYTPLQALFNTFLFAAPFTLILGFILRFFTENPLLVGLVIPNHYQLTLLILFAAFSTVLPYGLLNYVNPAEVSPTSEGTILLLDPALHIIWAALLLGQIVSLLQYFGIALILASAFAMLRL